MPLGIRKYEPEQEVQGQYMLTPKQLEEFNEQYGNLPHEMYMDRLLIVSRRIGYKEPDFLIN